MRSLRLFSTLLFLSLFAPSIGADLMMSRGAIGVGTVSPGLGVGPGEGRYDVEIKIFSYKRLAVYADDGGHKEWYCGMPDTLSDQCVPDPGGCPKAKLGRRCGDFIAIDGVKLRVKDIDIVSGPNPAARSAEEILGPYDVLGNEEKWEWASEGSLNALGIWPPNTFTRTTHQNTDIFYTRVNGIQWTGAPVQSEMRVKWFESDPGPFGVDDKSEWAYFQTGDMITR